MVQVVRKGKERRVPAYEGVPTMIRQVYMDYHLPMKPHGMTIRELKFWYAGLVPSLIKMGQSKKK